MSKEEDKKSDGAMYTYTCPFCKKGQYGMGGRPVCLYCKRPMPLPRAKRGSKTKPKK